MPFLWIGQSYHFYSNGTFRRELVPYDSPVVDLHTLSIKKMSTCGACLFILVVRLWNSWL